MFTSIKKRFFVLSFAFLAAFISLQPCQAQTEKQINVLGPLVIGDPLDITASQDNWTNFEKQLKQIKEAGVTGVEFDVWWGLVETNKNSYNWAYYDKMIGLI